tara:strand:+ start:141 stop:671 length:531 start_codon:yes stop_codon:yes gene_type:complete
MKIYKTKIDGILIIKGVKHLDGRGYLRELLLENKIKKNFKFHITSVSKKNILRGLHFQQEKPQGKFISVIKGEIFDTAVDLRKKSKTFGKSFTVRLSAENCKSLYIPPGFAHGFLTLKKENIVCYSCTEYRHQKGEKSLLYKDPKLKIKWPLKNPTVSRKDENANDLDYYVKKLFS